jgi:nucleotide-binding universal stress UspA family protein
VKTVEEKSMYRILVPLDGSRAAEQALPAACALARCANAELKLLHVVDLVHEVPSLDTTDEQWLHATARSDAERYLEQCGTQVTKSAAAPPDTVVIEGSPLEKIKEAATSWNADLIVMATHGRGAFDRAWLGSVADALARDSTTPVMLIRVQDQDRLVAPEAFRHVLIPLDGSRLAEHALEPAVRFTRCNNARITLLRVVRPFTFVSEPLASSLHAPPLPQLTLGALQREAREYLARTAHSLGAKVDHVASDVVVAESSDATEILAYARTHDVDLIALATHGRSGLKRLVLGSVADKLIRASPVPVLVVRPPSESASASS